jgi:hypothetical protein
VKWVGTVADGTDKISTLTGNLNSVIQSAGILLSGMHFQDGDVAIIQAQEGALKFCPKFA